MPSHATLPLALPTPVVAPVDASDLAAVIPWMPGPPLPPRRGLTDEDLERITSASRAPGSCPSGTANAALLPHLRSPIRERAHEVGLPNAERITGHSLRAGHATEAHRAGVPIVCIAAQTRHKGLSVLFNRYIRPVDALEFSSSKGLGL